MSLNRLNVINDALLASANEPINALFDGSVEWRVANAAFDRAMDYLVSAQVWQFATGTATLVNVDDNPSLRFSHAFARPQTAWLIRTVIETASKRPLDDYEVIGNRICCDRESGVAAQFVRQPDDTEVPPWFSGLVTEAVEVWVLRGLNEDNDEANRRERRVEARIADLRSREARQTPGRSFYAGGMRAARRTRRG